MMRLIDVRDVCFGRFMCLTISVYGKYIHICIQIEHSVNCIINEAAFEVSS